MTTSVLLLGYDDTPLRVIPWVRALSLLLDEKADLVEHYVGRMLRSTSISMPWPAVVRLRRFVSLQGRMRFSRRNVLARDNYRCSYCFAVPVLATGRPDLEALTLDHIIPRARSVHYKVLLPWSGRIVPATSWENVTTACSTCNSAKGNLPPLGSGRNLFWNVVIDERKVTLRLARFPRPPTAADMLLMSLRRIEIPEEWKEHLPKDSGWRGYWEDEIDAE
jgi:5-methylcytosine-specific restriction endonuclease McrA